MKTPTPAAARYVWLQFQCGPSGKPTTISFRSEQYLDLAHRAGSSRNLRQLVRDLMPTLPPMTGLPLGRQPRAKLDEVLLLV